MSENSNFESYLFISPKKFIILINEGFNYSSDNNPVWMNKKELKLWISKYKKFINEI